MQTSFVTVFSGSIANQPEQLCNARDLHATLKVETRFDTWITRRIAEYGFEKDQDYIVVSAKRATGAGKGRTDYHLTLDTAKELAMVEKTEVGRQIRRYFIRCEKELRGSGSLKITSAQKQQIQAAVNARVRRTGQTHQAVYTIVHQLAQVSSYHDIAAADFDKVMDYCLHGEILEPVLPDNELKPIMSLLAKLAAYTMGYRDIQQQMIAQPDQISYWFNNFKNAPEEGFLFVFKPDIGRDIEAAGIMMHRYKHLIA